MTIQGAIAELQNLLEVDDIPFYYKGGIKKVIETIQMDLADRKTENSSEKPNNCETCKQNKLEWYSEICDSCCGNNNHYEPKDEPTGYNLSPFDKDINVRSKDEPQTCSVNGRPYTECSDCEHFKCTADEPQTEEEILREQCRAFMGIVEQTERDE